VGRILAFLTELAAAARAIAEVVAIFGGRAGGRPAPARDVAHGAVGQGEPVVAAVDQPPGPAVGQPEVRGPEEGLADHS
jgi:hypothetical protein